MLSHVMQSSNAVFFFRCFFWGEPHQNFCKQTHDAKNWESKGYSFNGLSEKTSILVGLYTQQLQGTTFFFYQRVFDLQGKRDGGDQELRVFSRSGD